MLSRFGNIRGMEEEMTQVFQEKYTTGVLWWKHTYYTYWKYVKGNMMQIPLIGLSTMELMEKGKLCEINDIYDKGKVIKK